MAARTDQRQRLDPETCERGDAALARAFELLVQRWTGVVLGNLSSGPAGFRELSTRLTALGEAGLVTRVVDEGPPVAVAYGLTDAGRALIPALAQISSWAEEHLPIE